ncbi:MAG: Lrp/AsnC family transcriptional regulator [Candidatus Micrarchaeota archaeon]
MVEKLDKLDVEILSALKEDSKMSYRKLSERLGVHPNTLLQRIKKLEASEVIRKYTIDIDFEKLGYEMHVAVLMKVKGGHIGDYDQLKDVAKVPQVELLCGITGTYDVVCFIRVKDRIELVEVLKKLQMHPIIARTNSHTILYSYKRYNEFNPLSVPLP